MQMPLSRFVAVPVPEMKEKLESQIKQVETDVDGLDKRLHYLETTAKNSQVSTTLFSESRTHIEIDDLSGPHRGNAKARRCVLNICRALTTRHYHSLDEKYQTAIIAVDGRTSKRPASPPTSSVHLPNVVSAMSACPALHWNVTWTGGSKMPSIWAS